METLRARGLRLAVASSSYRRFVELVLEKLNLGSRFETVVTVDDVDRGKPDPAVFLLAAKHLQVQPGECLAYPASHEKARQSLALTLRWARRSQTALWRAEVEDQALFGIVQGGTHADRLISDLKDLPLSLFEG